MECVSTSLKTTTMEATISRMSVGYHELIIVHGHQTMHMTKSNQVNPPPPPCSPTSPRMGGSGAYNRLVHNNCPSASMLNQE